MSLSFISPLALVLLLLLPFLWALAFLTPRRTTAWRFWGSLILRSVIMLSLILALAGTQWVRETHNLTTVFLVDHSDSFSPAQRNQALDYINEALAEMPETAQAAVVVFGENALVEYAPSKLNNISRLSSLPIATHTNIQEAIQLGLALFPADTTKRLVLLSDGGQNSGQINEAIRLAQIRQIPIDVVPLQSQHGQDVIMQAVSVPTTVRVGQELITGISILSNYATSGLLQITIDNALVSEQQVQLNQGRTDLTLRLPVNQTGFMRIEAHIIAEGDSIGQNNRAAAFSQIQGPPRILMIASDPTRAENLANAFRAAGVDAIVQSPRQVPTNILELGEYAAVVLVDTAARDLPRDLHSLLPVYVEQLGRGMAMIGGSDSFGAGGYRRSKIEEMLPVLLDPIDDFNQPDVGVVLVIDRSGSMDEGSSTGSLRKIDLAKEAVYQSSLALGKQDKIGIVVFDTNANWVLPIQPLPDLVTIENALSRFNSNGGTDIRPGIQLAQKGLETLDSTVRHIILLTDAQADANYQDLIEEMSEQGITISTIGIQDTARGSHLAEMARIGNGRYYNVTNFSDIPQIMLQETILSVGRDIVEEPFVPQISLSSPIVRGLSQIPRLYGRNGNEIRPNARTILITPDQKPVLAQWQYGLGRVVAWSSDFKGQWGRDWVSWQGFPEFVGGLADMLVTSTINEQLTLQAFNEGNLSYLELTAQSPDGQALNNLALQGSLIDPSNQSESINFSQVAPGRYRAMVSTSTPGIYLALVNANGDNQNLGTVSSGLVVSYSPEYGVQSENIGAMQQWAELSNGRVNPPASAIFDPLQQPVDIVNDISLALLWLALLLLPLDIAIRRVFVRFKLPQRQASAKPANAPVPATISRLSQAKQRAQHNDAKPNPAPRQASIEANTPTNQAPSNAPAKAAPAEPAKDEPTTAPSSSEDQFARLLAAKQRARKRKPD